VRLDERPRDRRDREAKAGARVVLTSREELEDLLPPAGGHAGAIWCSETEAVPSLPPNSAAITPRIATPCRTLPTIFPNV